MSDTPENDPRSQATKPGYKTTEFWLSAAAMLVGLVLASGALSPDDPKQAAVLQVLGFVASTLAALGYTGCRTLTKNHVAGGAAMIAARALELEVAKSAERAAVAKLAARLPEKSPPKA